jgi:hypothetical protein
MSDTEIVLEAVRNIREGAQLIDIQNLIIKNKPNLIKVEVDMFASTIYDSLISHGG